MTTETMRLLTRAREALRTALTGSVTEVSTTEITDAITDLDAALTTPKPAKEPLLCLSMAYERGGIAEWLREFESMWDGDCWETHRLYFDEAIEKLSALAAPPANVEKMRAALEPFAKAADKADAAQLPSGALYAVIKVADLRAARAALDAAQVERLTAERDAEIAHVERCATAFMNEEVAHTETLERATALAAERDALAAENARIQAARQIEVTTVFKRATAAEAARDQQAAMLKDMNALAIALTAERDALREALKNARPYVKAVTQTDFVWPSTVVAAEKYLTRIDALLSGPQ